MCTFKIQLMNLLLHFKHAQVIRGFKMNFNTLNIKQLGVKEIDFLQYYQLILVPYTMYSISTQLR